MEIGDKILSGNPEDMWNLKIFELNDIYELSLNDYFFEIFEYNILLR